MSIIDKNELWRRRPVARTNWRVRLAIVIAGVAAIAVIHCTKGQQQIVHMSTHACLLLAQLRGDPAFIAACQAGHDVSEHVMQVQSDTCVLPTGDAGVDSGTVGR